VTCTGPVSAIIVGGRITGLSAGIFLAYHGVTCVVVERVPNYTADFGARVLSARSMELFRQVGMGPEIEQLDNSGKGLEWMLKVDSLAGPEFVRFPIPRQVTPGRVSSAGEVICQQEELEPLLRHRAEELGADVRYGTELAAFEHDDTGVRAVIRSVRTGQESVVYASYMLACDGPASSVREQLGVALAGPGFRERQLNIIFDADLTEASRGRDFAVCLADRVPGALLIPRPRDRWELTVPAEPWDDVPADDRCAELVRAVVGLPELPLVITNAAMWDTGALVATRFREGRVLLLGDAAHAIPPTGGLGANTGVQDAHNLAWKLAAVLAGIGGERLLDTYDAERRPVAVTTMRDHIDRAEVIKAVRYRGGSLATVPQPHDYESIVFGYRYRSEAVMVEDWGNDAPLEDPRTPSGRPGTRAAHLEIERAGRRCSLLDLFGRNFVVLTGSSDGKWRAAGQRAAAVVGATVPCYAVGPHAEWRAPEGELQRSYGIDDVGAVVVRPDGFVGWRSVRGVRDPSGALEHVMRRLLCRGIPTGTEMRRNSLLGR
jgi:2-polyprenyl-6-methoxyphenol hydroxylase-like FAD-dependent oxidoreductase